MPVEDSKVDRNSVERVERVGEVGG